MAQLLAKIPDLIQLIALIGMAVSVLATLLVRLTPSKADDEAVGKATAFFLKILKWMPTIGVNPQTKKLEEAYEELKAKEAPVANVEAAPKSE